MESAEDAGSEASMGSDEEEGLDWDQMEEQAARWESLNLRV